MSNYALGTAGVTANVLLLTLIISAGANVALVVLFTSVIEFLLVSGNTAAFLSIFPELSRCCSLNLIYHLASMSTSLIPLVNNCFHGSALSSLIHNLKISMSINIFTTHWLHSMLKQLAPFYDTIFKVSGLTSILIFGISNHGYPTTTSFNM